MRELHFILDEVSGDLTVEGLSDDETRSLTGDLLPPPLAINCALPAAVSPVPGAEAVDGPSARVFGVWHGSVAEGPGRRSVVGFSGCPIRCAGCLVPHTWPQDSGSRRAVAAIADALLDPAHPRDGVSVVGGEPFAQPEGLAALLVELRRREPGLHLTAYSGYTLGGLGRRREPSVRAALDLLDLLIDGPFVRRLHHGAGEWRGSTNQRLIPHPGRALATGRPIPRLSARAWLAGHVPPGADAHDRVEARPPETRTAMHAQLPASGPVRNGGMPMPTAEPCHEPTACYPSASSVHPRFIYLGRGGHAPPVVSNEEHDPLTVRGRQAICHLIALAEYDRAAFRTDIAYSRHCQARARYLHAHIGDLTRHALDDLLRRPPAATVRSLLPDTWAAEGAAAGAVGED